MEVAFDLYKEVVLVEDETNPHNINNIHNLIEKENSRIEQKGSLINPLYDTKKRKELMAKSTTARNQVIHQMFLTVLVVCIISVVLTYVNATFSVFPSLVLEMLIIAGFGGGIAYILYLYVDMQKRDKVDFNKVDFSALLNPPPPGTAVGAITATDNTNLDCVGNACCPAGSYFVDNKCTAKESFSGKFEPFTPIPEYFKSR